MAKAIFLTALTVLAVIGLADLIRSFSAWVLSGCRRQFVLAVIPCRGHEDDIEYIVKSTYHRLKEQYRCRGCRIILADGGLDAQTRKICEQLCRSLDCVSLWEEKDVGSLLQEKFHLQINA